MGKPFAKELTLLEKTINWANSLELDSLSTFFSKIKAPIYLVGSGGSLSACHFAVSLLNKKGKFAKAITPLELFHLKETIHNSSVIFISASGRNYDIRFSYKVAVEQDPKNIGIICMKEDNPLTKISLNHGLTNSFCYNLPSGKDGFLATNSLMAFYLVFNNGLSNNRIKSKPITKSFNKSIDSFLNSTDGHCTYIVLYSGWNKSVALDIESKCSEAGLDSILISDYRNFGHGRHNWFDKHDRSAIIALCNEEDNLLAKKTIGLLPESIPKLLLESKEKDSISCIDLLKKSFIFINELGKKKGIDPGKPGVPSYGSKLYNLPYSSLLPKEREIKISIRAKTAIKRKLNIYDLSLIDENELKMWVRAYNSFINNLKKASFGLIMFDYDGTLCSSSERYSVPSLSITQKLNEIIKNGFYIGIATGRGKSAREALQKILPKKFWKKVIIGYYNGSDCGTLEDNELPNKNRAVSPSLEKLESELKRVTQVYGSKIELRPNQITIEVSHIKRWYFIRNLIIQTIKTNYSIDDIQILESSHSMDIIPLSVSKMNIISYAKNILKKSNISQEILCIGDKGQWSGNDFSLLDSKYGLSVHEVSPKLNKCWNISSLGHRNVSATLEYLNSLSFEDTSIKFKINK
ncbi:HAD hydrolase family protein [Flavobacteriaceae bacterium R38]|nr:HAD hydrolase family protein [Flavobacteriaceae bacterium R38]